MQVAIISDVHNNLVNLKKVLDYLKAKKIKILLCLGDLASKETLDYLCDNFVGEVFYTFGNMDNDFLRDLEIMENYRQVKTFKKFGEVEIDKYKVAFVHFPEIARELAQTGSYTHVFYGHTHKPWQEKIDNCLILNPGNVANEYFAPTFAVWNTIKNEFELILVNNLS